MKRPVAINIAAIMHILLAVTGVAALRLIDDSTSKAIRLCYEGFILLNIIGCVAIFIRARGARLFTILLFTLYFGTGIYQAFRLIQSEFTPYSFVSNLCVPVIVGWVAIEFVREPVRRYFAN
jgi:hypothetical protein